MILFDIVLYKSLPLKACSSMCTIMNHDQQFIWSCPLILEVFAICMAKKQYPQKPYYEAKSSGMEFVLSTALCSMNRKYMLSCFAYAHKNNRFPQQASLEMNKFPTKAPIITSLPASFVDGYLKTFASLFKQMQIDNSV